MSVNSKTDKLVSRISRGDFPRTKWCVQFGVLKALQAAFNYARMYPAKMESLKMVLEFTLEKVYNWEEAQTSPPGDYKIPTLRVDTTVTNVLGLDGKPMPVIRDKPATTTYGERQQPSTPVVPPEPARVVATQPPMQSSKLPAAVVKEPESTQVSDLPPSLPSAIVPNTLGAQVVPAVTSLPPNLPSI